MLPIKPTSLSHIDIKKKIPPPLVKHLSKVASNPVVKSAVHIAPKPLVVQPALVTPEPIEEEKVEVEKQQKIPMMHLHIKNQTAHINETKALKPVEVPKKAINTPIKLNVVKPVLKA